MNTIIEASGLTKNYKNVQALKNVSFLGVKGRCVVILGPNGAGKTTLMEILEGIITPCSGTVKLFGMSPSDIKCRQRIGVQTEAGVFEGELKVLEILNLYSSFYNTGINHDFLLKALGLTAKKNSFFSQLSKGMKQKVAVAVALVGDPEIVFLDEPSSGLDIESRRDVWEFIQDLKKTGKTIIMTTHDIQEAGALADRVMILSLGHVKVDGSLSSLFESFPTKRKVEYFGTRLAESGGFIMMSVANKQLVFTDDPDNIISEVKKAGGRDVVISDVNLEDVYMYYQKGIK